MEFKFQALLFLLSRTVAAVLRKAGMQGLRELGETEGLLLLSLAQ